MSVTALSANSRRVIEEAYDIAHQADQNWTTAHLLLAFFVVPNSAERLLTDRGVNEEGLLSQLDAMESERLGLSEVVEHRATKLAEETGADSIFCLHLLAALTELKESIAFRLLERAHGSIDTLRELALEYATHGAPPHWYTNESTEATHRQTDAFAVSIPMNSYTRKNTQHNNMNWVKSRYKRRRSENRLEESRLSIVKENSVGGSQAQSVGHAHLGGAHRTNQAPMADVKTVKAMPRTRRPPPDPAGAGGIPMAD